MRFISLSFVFLLTREIRPAYSPNRGAGNFDVATWPNDYLRSQSSSDSSSNPCVLTNIASGAPNADIACHNECLASRAVTSSILQAFPNFDSVKYLYSKCGTVTQGMCSAGNSNSVQVVKQTVELEETTNIASQVPICWCFTSRESKNEWTNTLSNCRYGIQLVQKFTKAVASTSATARSINKRNTLWEDISEMRGHEAVHMQQDYPPTSAGRIPKRQRSNVPRRTNTGLMAACCGLSGRTDSPDLPPASPASGASSPRRGEKSPDASSSGVKDVLKGRLLYTPVRVSRNVVQALVDTGGEVCLINQQYAGDIVTTENEIIGAAGDSCRILGTTTIHVEMDGVRIRVTGYVVDRMYEIVLGTDFFVAHRAKIRIIDRKMEIASGRETVTANIQFMDRQIGNVGVLRSNSGGYTALQIAVRLNGNPTRMVIDTGSDINIVNMNYARSQPIRRANIACTVVGSTVDAGFSGETTIRVGIENVHLFISALVPQFTFDDAFLTGNEFNERYVELIDYESSQVTLRIPSPLGYMRVTTTAFVNKGR